MTYFQPFPAFIRGHGVEGDFFISRSQTGMLDHAFHLSIYTDR